MAAKSVAKFWEGKQVEPIYQVWDEEKTKIFPKILGGAKALHIVFLKPGDFKCVHVEGMNKAGRKFIISPLFTFSFLL